MRTALVLVLSLCALAACGLRGDLERPVPLFGNPPNEGPNDPRTLKAAADAAKAEKERQEAERRAQEAAQPAATPTPAPATPQ